MSNYFKQLISLTLLLCFVATLIPFNLIHEHDDSRICDDEHIDIVINLCHNSEYHWDSEAAKCEHEKHFNEISNDCELCKFINNQRFEFTLDQSTIDIPILLDQFLPQFDNSFTQFNTVRSVLGRAPPAC